jgi:hypothetical protein
MDFRAVLPSAQFALVTASLALSAAFVFAADRLTREPQPGRLAADVQARPAVTGDWQATLAQIQTENSTLPPAPPEEVYQALIAEAQSDTVTDTVSRTLFVNLSNAGVQGLGSDIPTQDQLIASALAELDKKTLANTYATTDLSIIADSSDALRVYGNTFITVLAAHPQASVNETFLALGYAAERDDKTYFQQLVPIENAYRALARALVVVPVPRTLAPLHLAVVNNFAKIANTYPDLRATPTDPLRGLAGLHSYQALTNETGRMFTTIAEQLRNSAILFSEEEAGSAWSAFLPVSPL